MIKISLAQKKKKKKGCAVALNTTSTSTPFLLSSEQFSLYKYGINDFAFSLEKFANFISQYDPCILETLRVSTTLVADRVTSLPLCLLFLPWEFQAGCSGTGTQRPMSVSFKVSDGSEGRGRGHAYLNIYH